MSGGVSIEPNGPILQVIIDRSEKKNALTFAMYENLTRALLDADINPTIKVVVLSGSNGAFTAGNDLKDFLTATSEPGRLSAAGDFLKAISTLQKPIIAAVDGLAIGIGTSMLLHCDLVYCNASAVFQLPFTRLGVVPEGGTSLLLPQRLGHRTAFELLALGEPFDATKALKLGIVNEVVPEESALDKAMQVAEQLLTLPPQALLKCKALLKAPVQAELQQTIDQEMEHFAQALQEPESLEAITALMEKRVPDFSSC
ncbi:enoyl-CoA hydratase [Pontibacterium sp.]|uniref:enoyl-CoA hydratase n=1 Tax=Pontibacterium sp. TaxID=2036026 RepID=UPI0035171DB3